MDWLTKKKKVAAAKISKKRTAFSGDGNVLGGGEASTTASLETAVPQRPSMINSVKSSFHKKPPALTAEDQQKRREQQAKALEQRTGAWDKRVATARKARLQQNEEKDSKFQYEEPPVAPTSGPPPTVLSNEQVKARELQSVQQQMGFNPYAATFSSSTQAASVMNGIGGGSATPLNAVSSFPASMQALGSNFSSLDGDENGAVFVLLRQEAPIAITAAEALIKILANVVKNPEEDKFRKIRLSNAIIQSKIVSVPGAVDLLIEAGFSMVEQDGDHYLILPTDTLRLERVQSAIDRIEVALIQLQHDSA